MKIFSSRHRPVHLGPYPLERLRRAASMPAPETVPPAPALDFNRPEHPESLVNAMGEFQAMMDTIRDGLVNPARAEIPADGQERARHLKAFGYFCDASMVGIGRLPASARLAAPRRNPDIDRLARDLATRQTKTLASGIDVIMADLRDSVANPPGPLGDHGTVLVFLYEYLRDPRPDEPGAGWILDAQAHRACLRASETAVVVASYLRLLGWQARAHTATTTDIDLNVATVAAGLAVPEGDSLQAPWLGTRFGVAAVTTDMDIAHDLPLAPMAQQSWWWRAGPGWWLDRDHPRAAFNRDPYARRDYAAGPHPFETLRRVETPTTRIDEPNVPRVPRRTDMFARAQFGDLGPRVQKNAAGGYYARKSAPSLAQRRLLGALVLLQDGEPAGDAPRPDDPARNAACVKAASYFLGIDAVGLSRCPEWAWYSHDARGDSIDPPHDQAISMIVDQGWETMEGASGDDWISVAQSMRAYLRFSVLGGVIARQIRNLGWSARAHTVLDGDVLQPPLLLLSGLGEVSRIGEVILNPFLGPRLKSGVVTTDMPLAHDRPIDFGLQRFCEGCNKCARECPSGAITAGPKLMFNGYEIWKSDSQKCATYRITTEGGAMCGRCMKTCPWNLEGIFAEAPFRWLATRLPQSAPVLQWLDDALGRGGLNRAKKWWWDIELHEDGAYRAPRAPVNRRDLQPRLRLRPEDQTLAVYPAPLAPPPWPYPFPMDREKGIEAYRSLVSAEEHFRRLERGETSHLHRYRVPADSPVLKVVVDRVEQLTERVRKYEFRRPDGQPLPPWTAGAHIDVVIAPEFLRQYSMSGDPADRSRYQIAVQREDGGRGGSRLMHRIFDEGRVVFISRPMNHFPLDETAPFSLLMGAGIGVTPMIAFAHRLHALGRDFRLHYSVSRRGDAAFLRDIATFPWADRVVLHVSDEGRRADPAAILAAAPEGAHVYVCGPDRYIGAVTEAAAEARIPEEAVHVEYFSLPEEPDYVNHPFTLRLPDGREVQVPADMSAADALDSAGLHVDVKCSDGLCGVCQARLVGGEVEHRDHVLSKAQRAERIILCRSRAAAPGGVLEIELPEEV